MKFVILSIGLDTDRFFIYYQVYPYKNYGMYTIKLDGDDPIYFTNSLYKVSGSNLAIVSNNKVSDKLLSLHIKNVNLDKINFSELLVRIRRQITIKNIMCIG